MFLRCNCFVHATPGTPRWRDTMPTYLYSCQKCGKNFERTEHIAEHESMKHRCPKCKSTKVIHGITPFFARTAKKG